MSDTINNPSHYTSHPSGIECIAITEHMNFLLGNAMKYIWRADFKNGVEDLKKAAWYINREIEKREPKKQTTNSIGQIASNPSAGYSPHNTMFSR